MMRFLVKRSLSARVYRLRRYAASSVVARSLLKALTASTRSAIGASLRSIKARVLYMPSETDLYFPITDARYEQALIPRVTFTPIPSLWGHTAGAASNPADLRFLNERIAAFLK